MNKFLLILLISAFFSCAGSQNKPRPQDKGTLESENQILRKRIVAVERKNSVLEDENNRYRKDTRDQKAQIEKLSSDIRSLKEKYDNEIILWTQKYDNIMKKNEILDKESSEKLRELTDLNNKIEKDLGAQIKRLNDEMAAREKTASALLVSEKKSAAEREYKLAGEIEKHKKEIILRDEKIISLDAVASAQTRRAEALVNENKNAADELNKSTAENQRLIKENEKLKVSNAEFSSRINDLERELKQIKTRQSGPGGTD